MRAILALPLLVLAGAAQAGSLTLPTVTFTATATTVEKPGPSAALFANPYYRCNTNFYVSQGGSDSNNGSQGSPWATLQKANNAVTGPAGACINVAPGTYGSGVDITKGGNAATSTGYLVYRCTVMDACKITDNFRAFMIEGTPASARHVIIDGFEMAASSGVAYGQGVRIWDGGNGPQGVDSAFVTDHIWLLNSIVHGYGQSGAQMNDGEYYYLLHNTFYQNSKATCDARGSGISLAAAKARAGYVQTADDKLTPFHNIISWNVVYTNNVGTCGVSDGNGIIMDSWNNDWNNFGMYPNKSLIAFNVVYNNGNAGIGLTWADHFVVANNSVYNNDLDTRQTGTYRPGIGSQVDSSTGHDHTYISNIAVGIPAGGSLAANSPFCADTTDSTIANNVAIGPTNGGCKATINCTANKCNPTYSQATVNQYFTNVGKTSTGNLNTAPVGTNFALPSGSPAIGYGFSQPYLSPQAVDAGACYHTLATCP